MRLWKCQNPVNPFTFDGIVRNPKANLVARPPTGNVLQVRVFTLLSSPEGRHTIAARALLRTVSP